MSQLSTKIAEEIATKLHEHFGGFSYILTTASSIIDKHLWEKKCEHDEEVKVNCCLSSGFCNCEPPKGFECSCVCHQPPKKEEPMSKDSGKEWPIWCDHIHWGGNNWYSFVQESQIIPDLWTICPVKDCKTPRPAQQEKKLWLWEIIKKEYLNQWPDDCGEQSPNEGWSKVEESAKAHIIAQIPSVPEMHAAYYGKNTLGDKLQAVRELIIKAIQEA